MKKHTIGFRVGDVVRLKPSPPETATIKCFLPDIKGGVMLHNLLEGWRYWNVRDLILVYRGKRKVRK